MKITFICDTLKLGGPQRVMVALANELAKEGQDISLTTVKDDVSDYELHKDVKHIYNAKFSSIKIVRLIQKFFWYQSFLKNDTSDIIVSFYYTINMNLMLHKMLGAKNKIVISERNDPANEPKSSVLRFFRTLLYGYADGLVYQTEDAEAYYAKYHAIPHRVIPNPMRTDLPERYEGTRRKSIVNFCRVSKQKNLKLLIDAFNFVHKDYDDICLEIYGNGPLKNELEEYALEIELENVVKFYDATPDVHNKINDALMFVSSSDYEGMSNSMMEALGMGMPVICTDCPCGGARALINSYDNGILVPVGNVDALSKAMRYFIENPDKAECMGINAYKLNDDLNIEQISGAWKELFSQVLQ